MIKHLCPVCREETAYKVVDLGRAESRRRGDEGHEFYTFWACPLHGEVVPLDVTVCDYCHKEAPCTMQVVEGADEDYFALVCSEECRQAMCFVPHFARKDFKKRAYKALPARDGKIYRLRCQCGELPDGDIWEAIGEDCAAYACNRCLPES